MKIRHRANCHNIFLTKLVRFSLLAAPKPKKTAEAKPRKAPVKRPKKVANSDSDSDLFSSEPKKKSVSIHF